MRPTDRGDGMAWLTALLPIEDAYAVKVALDAAADTAVAMGVASSRGNVRADTLVARITGSDALGLDAPQHRVRLNLVMTDTSLIGSSSEPAWLVGMGPIAPNLARDLLLGSINSGMVTTLRRLYTEPASRQLVSMESKARRFPDGLAEFIRLRDQLCATPNCGAPIAHIDHEHDLARGGTTTATNGQGLCRQCNWAKQNPDLHPPSVDVYYGSFRVELDANYPRAA